MQENVKETVCQAIQERVKDVKIIKTQDGFKFTRYGLEGEVVESLSSLASCYSLAWAIKRSGKGITVIFE